jgi:hypothetical protein
MEPIPPSEPMLQESPVIAAPPDAAVAALANPEPAAAEAPVPASTNGAAAKARNRARVPADTGGGPTP